MRLPRVRFTVRRLMIAVAIVALILGAEKAHRRWSRLHLWARNCGLMVEAERQQMTEDQQQLDTYDENYADMQLISELNAKRYAYWGMRKEQLRYSIEVSRQKAEYYRQHQQAYESAAIRQWLPEPPNPPLKPFSLEPPRP